MSGLFHTLNIGAQSLYATRQGVDTAGHNIANAQVEGYSRQRVNLTQRDPLETMGILIGNGAYVESITRSHDDFVEKQLNLAHQESGRSATRAEAMKSIEEVFSPDLSASISDEATKFFNSLQNLSNFPADATVRTALVEAGHDVAAAFRRVDSSLNANRQGLNQKIYDIAHKVTDSAREIANLNVKIQISEGGIGEVANDLRDQRDKLVRELSQQIEIKYYEDGHGMLSIRGPSQVTLVDGGHSCSVNLESNSENSGLFDVSIMDWEGHSNRNVTNKMDGGAMEALLQVRDVDAVKLIEKNNHMAATLIAEVNDVHQQGFGLGAFSEHQGRNFFEPADDFDSTAASFAVADVIVQSNDAISAASTANAPGDNVNLNLLIKLKDKRMFSDENVTFNGYYSNLTGALGLDVVRAEHVKSANDLLVSNINQKRESVSGVSLDEEAANMMKWQANFTASSKVITTIDEMLDTVLQLKR